RYAVRVHRDDEAVLEMNPAPGYDPLMPHDLLHLVVEEELALQRGIFGQVARGGHAATFHAPSAGGDRVVARRRRRAEKRGDALLRAGREESQRSENATYVCLYEWLRRSSSPTARARAHAMRDEAAHVRAREDERVLTDAAIDRICARL